MVNCEGKNVKNYINDYLKLIVSALKKCNPLLSYPLHVVAYAALYSDCCGWFGIDLNFIVFCVNGALEMRQTYAEFAYPRYSSISHPIQCKFYDALAVTFFTSCLLAIFIMIKS